MPSVIDRFEEKFIPEPNSGCWLWLAAVNKHGYGWFSPKSYSADRAHRVAYQLYCSEIPSGKHVLHICDNRLCVNPEHLYLGDNSDNVRDRHVRGRDAKPNARLSVDQVREIRSRSKTRTRASLAREYGIDASCISNILLGKAWKDV